MVLEWDIVSIGPGGSSPAEFRYEESEWIVCINGITRTAIERNRKTGEQRLCDYNSAMEAFLGR